MVLPWFGVVMDKNADPERILAVKQTGCSTPARALSPIPARAPGIPGLPFPLPGKKDE
jgi:hypothetical protein